MPRNATTQSTTPEFDQEPDHGPLVEVPLHDLAHLARAANTQLATQRVENLLHNLTAAIAGVESDNVHEYNALAGAFQRTLPILANHAPYADPEQGHDPAPTQQPDTRDEVVREPEDPALTKAAEAAKDARSKAKTNIQRATTPPPLRHDADDDEGE